MGWFKAKGNIDTSVSFPVTWVLGDNSSIWAL